MLASAHLGFGNFDKAINCYQKAFEIQKNLSYKTKNSGGFIDFAKTYFYQGKYSEAKNTLTELNKLFRKFNDSEMVIKCEILKTIIYKLENNLEKALSNLEEIEKFSKEKKVNSLNPSINYQKAEINYKLKNFHKAAESLSTLTESDLTKEPKLKIILAKVNFSLGKTKAISDLKKFLDETKDIEILAEIHYELYVMGIENQTLVTNILSLRDLQKHHKKALEYFESIYAKRPIFQVLKKIEELKNSNIQLKFLNQKLISSISRFMNPMTAFSELLNFLIEQCSANCCQIIVYNERLKKYEVKAISTTLTDEETDFSEHIIKKCISNGESILISNAVKLPEFNKNSSIAGKVFLSVIAVPLRLKNGNVIGALYLDRREFLSTPFDNDLIENVQNIADILTPLLIQNENLSRIKTESEIHKLGLFIGKSREMEKLYSEIEKSANIKLTLYIQGETGTGKELVAEALHNLSDRKENPFVVINCAAIPKQIAESELFGYEKGAFTGAVKQKKGKFELAQNGTLFLDEVAELPLDIQAKLLRVLQKKEIWRIGGQNSIQINVRVIVATHKDLYEEVKKGKFREDLYHRLDVLRINVPPLRERKSDIPLLAYHFLQKYLEEIDKKINGFTGDALNALCNYNWPGNVRELENTIAKTVVKHENENPIDFFELFDSSQLKIKGIANKKILFVYEEGKTFNELKSDFEKFVLEKILKKNKWHKSKTAQELNISRSTIDLIIKRNKIKH